jgi:hypothetical protein
MESVTGVAGLIGVSAGTGVVVITAGRAGALDDELLGAGEVAAPPPDCPVDAPPLLALPALGSAAPPPVVHPANARSAAIDTATPPAQARKDPSPDALPAT